jgi:hypothetical protein
MRVISDDKRKEGERKKGGEEKGVGSRDEWERSAL